MHYGIALATFRTPQFQEASRFESFMNEDVKELKDSLENLNTKEHIRIHFKRCFDKTSVNRGDSNTINKSKTQMSVFCHAWH